MARNVDVAGFFDAVWRQDGDAMRAYFRADAVISWLCTNERFTVEEFIKANCAYPGDWAGELERVERMDGCTVAAARVYERNGDASFHVVSFLREAEEKIAALDEYWGDDGTAPAWRRALHIGRPLRQESEADALDMGAGAAAQ